MKLIKAVSHPAGGENPSLAMKIAKNHEGMCKSQGWEKVRFHQATLAVI